ncbi:MAG: hypothetical protein NZ529_10290 [Cytophagaceae bacterium]|nr:hypothetical protein [Cytophagaceae bacterium]MDW8457174.1 hypothetical protein [Cytophagaceae bacterium]
MKNLKKIPNLLFLLSVWSIIFLYSCKHPENFKDHIGPSICESSTFAFINEPTLNKTAIDLNVDTLKITAQFNEEVPWQVKISGTISGSIKRFKGYGSSIHLKWLGNPDTNIFFKNENCIVTFKIGCKVSVEKTFSISNTNKFKNFNYLVYDADGNGYVATPISYGTYATHTTVTPGPSTLPESPAGGRYWSTVGNSGSTKVWYFGGLDFSLPPGPSSSPALSRLGTDPDKVYFNFFVNSNGNTVSIPVVTFLEGGVQRNYNIITNKTGWQYVSFKLSQANIVDPTKITSISFGLNA